MGWRVTVEWRASSIDGQTAIMFPTVRSCGYHPLTKCLLSSAPSLVGNALEAMDLEAPS